MFSMALHSQIREARAVNVESVNGATTASKSAHRDRAHCSQPGLLFVVLPPENHDVSCIDGSQPKQVSDLRPHESYFNLFSSSESTHRAAPVVIPRDRTLRQTYARGLSRHVL